MSREYENLINRFLASPLDRRSLIKDALAQSLAAVHYATGNNINPLEYLTGVLRHIIEAEVREIRSRLINLIPRPDEHLEADRYHILLGNSEAKIQNSDVIWIAAYHYFFERRYPSVVALAKDAAVHRATAAKWLQQAVKWITARLLEFDLIHGLDVATVDSLAIRARPIQTLPLEELMSSKDIGLQLTGVSGSGKTTLAFQTAEILLKTRRVAGAVWVSLKTTDGKLYTVSDALLQIYQAANNDYREVPGLKTIWERLSVTLAPRKDIPMLVVLDALETVHDADQLINELGQNLPYTRWLITTQGPISYFQSVPVKPVADEDLVAFLSARVQARISLSAIKSQGSVQVQDIKLWTRGLPLALNVLGDMFRQLGITETARQLAIKSAVKSLPEALNRMYSAIWNSLNSDTRRLCIAILLSDPTAGAQDVWLSWLGGFTQLDSPNNQTRDVEAKRYPTRDFVEAREAAKSYLLINGGSIRTHWQTRRFLITLVSEGMFYPDVRDEYFRLRERAIRELPRLVHLNHLSFLITHLPNLLYLVNEVLPYAYDILSSDEVWELGAELMDVCYEAGRWIDGLKFGGRLVDLLYGTARSEIARASLARIAWVRADIEASLGSSGQETRRFSGKKDANIVGEIWAAAIQHGTDAYWSYSSNEYAETYASASRALSYLQGQPFVYQAPMVQLKALAAWGEEKFAEAATYFDEARRFYFSRNDYVRTVRAQAELGLVYFSNQKFGLALETLRSGLDLCRQYSAYWLEAGLAGNLALCLMLSGDLDEAKITAAWHLNCLDRLQVSTRERGRAKVHEALIYLYSDDIDFALQTLRADANKLELRRIPGDESSPLEDAGSRFRRDYVLLNLAYAYIATNNNSDAIQILADFDAMFPESGPSIGALQILRRRVGVLTSSSISAKHDLLHEAINIARQVGRPFDEAACFLQLSLIAPKRRASNIANAIQLLEESGADGWSAVVKNGIIPFLPIMY